MAISLSFKIITTMALFMVIVAKLTHAYDEDSDSYDEELICPEEFMELYKECKGAVIACSDCLQKAERECVYRERTEINYDREGTCTECTTLFGRRCDKATNMCFGYQDCGGGNLHCVNFKCVYFP